jgi:hypothetical protein
MRTAVKAKTPLPFPSLQDILPVGYNPILIEPFSVNKNQIVYIGDYNAETSSYPTLSSKTEYKWRLISIENKFNDIKEKINSIFPNISSLGIKSVF